MLPYLPPPRAIDGRGRDVLAVEVSAAIVVFVGVADLISGGTSMDVVDFTSVFTGTRESASTLAVRELAVASFTVLFI